MESGLPGPNHASAQTSAFMAFPSPTFAKWAKGAAPVGLALCAEIPENSAPAIRSSECAATSAAEPSAGEPSTTTSAAEA